MSKKLHQKDLRRDEVVEAVSHAAEGTVEFSKQHRSAILYAVVAVAVIALVSVIVAWRLDASRRAALADLSEASTAWAEVSGERPVEEGVTKPTWDEVAEKYEEVAEKHGGSKAGQLARLHQGLALSKAGKAEEAVAVLEAFTDEHSSHWAAPEALAALAVAQEDAGDAAAAEATLVKLRDGNWRAWPDGAASLLLAQLYERQGRTAEARTIYESMSKDEKLKDSTWASQAKARLDEMGDAPAAG